MPSPAPRIHFAKDLEIGYDKPLARFQESTMLGSGTHFLLARNGRGKTTLLRTISRSLKPVSGRIESHGFMQYLPEDIRFDPEISARQIFRSLLPQRRTDEAFALAEKIELNLKKPYGRLSTGNRRKVHLISAEFSTAPEGGNILLLDEPFSGLDAFARQAFEELWARSEEKILRLVSCHPDYDSMKINSALLIDGAAVKHLGGPHTWQELKTLLN